MQNRSGEGWHKSKLLKNTQIISKVGAGDAFCAACLYGIHEDWDIEKILKKAHSAASSILKTEFSSGNIPNIKYL